MQFAATVTIQATRSAVWRAITDVENAPRVVPGIVKTEVLTRPRGGLVGLTWRETRILFGDESAVEKTVTDAVDGASFSTTAAQDGLVFTSTTTLSGADGAVVLHSVHTTAAQTALRKFMMVPMRLFFTGVARKAIQRDLDDVKSFVERAPLA